MFNNNINYNYNNYNYNNCVYNNSVYNISSQNNTFNGIENVKDNVYNSNNIYNRNSINNKNNIYNNNIPYNSINNFNMYYNYSLNKQNFINGNNDEINTLAKKNDQSLIGQTLKENKIVFNNSIEANQNTNNSANSINNSKHKLFLNLNPYNSTFIRDKDKNMSQFFPNVNNIPNNLNYVNEINNLPKKSHSDQDNNNYNNENRNYNSSLNNENLSYSSIGSNKTKTKPKRSSLFQNGANKEKDLRDFKRFCEGLKTSMPEYICSQIGSRIMQKYLKRFPSFIRTLLINKIDKFFDKLMCDTYGNYFCQKLYHISEIEQRIIILNSLKESFIKISKNSCGAHVTQFIIESVRTIEEKIIIIEYINGHELELALDQEGNHVLQKIINCFNENERQSINTVLLLPHNLNILCQDIKGMCVIKKLIGNTKNENNKKKIIDGICKYFIEIAQSPFGNYIIQFILEEWDPSVYFNLINKCLVNSILLSSQKYSSNIIVKIIELNKNNINYNFVHYLKNIFFDNKNFLELYNNKYGRLLLSRIGRIMSKEEKDNLIQMNKDKISLLVEIFE